MHVGTTLGRRSAMGAFVASALLCLIGLVQPSSAFVALVLLPVPFGLVGLRFGARPGMVAGAVLGVASGFAAAMTWSTGQALGVGVLVWCAVAGISWVASTCGIGRRSQLHPYAAVAGAWLLTLAAAAVLVVVVDGPASARAGAGVRLHSLADSYRTRTAGESSHLDRDCAAGGVSHDTVPCTVYREAGRSEQTMRHLAFPITSIGLALYALVAAAVMLVAMRRLAVLRALPMQMRRPFAVFETHFAVYYAAAIGILLWLTTRHVHGWLGTSGRAVGATLGITGVLLVLVQGVAVTGWWLRVRGLRRWAVAIFWIVALISLLSTVHSLAYVSGFFAAVSMLETMFQLRRRIASRMAPPE